MKCDLYEKKLADQMGTWMRVQVVYLIKYAHDKQSDSQSIYLKTDLFSCLIACKEPGGGGGNSVIFI